MSLVHALPPSVVLILFTSSTWGALGLKILRRVVGIALSVIRGVVKKTWEGHQGKEGKRILVTDSSHRFSMYVPVPLHMY